MEVVRCIVVDLVVGEDGWLMVVVSIVLALWRMKVRPWSTGSSNREG